MKQKFIYHLNEKNDLSPRIPSFLQIDLRFKSSKMKHIVIVMKSYFNNISPIYYIDMYGVISNKMTNNFLSDKGSLTLSALASKMYPEGTFCLRFFVPVLCV